MTNVVQGLRFTNRHLQAANIDHVLVTKVLLDSNEVKVRLIRNGTYNLDDTFNLMMTENGLNIGEYIELESFDLPMPEISKEQAECILNNVRLSPCTNELYIITVDYENNQMNQLNLIDLMEKKSVKFWDDKGKLNFVLDIEYIQYLKENKDKFYQLN